MSMKIGLISDIHGNYPALRAVLSALDDMDVSVIYCLGDVVGYYSQVNECCDAVRNRGIACVMGNHDWYLSSGGYCLRSKSVRDCLVHQRAVVSPENLQWLKSFPVNIVAHGLNLVHGGWSDPIDEYLEPSAEYFEPIPGSFFVSGHTHKQSVLRFGDRAYCNPGSVGQPRDGDPRAAFAVFEDGEFFAYRAQYDRQEVFALMEKAGFSDYYYGCLETGACRLCRLPTACPENTNGSLYAPRTEEP